MPKPTSRGRAMSRLWANDEELAKKDDDLNAPQRLRQGAQWQSARVPRRSSVIRLAAFSLACFFTMILVFRLFNSSPPAELQRAHSDRYTSHDLPQFDVTSRPEGKKDERVKSKGMDFVPTRTFSGPVKLPALGQSLHGIAGTNGKQAKNRNVLFAAASLKSAATVLPMACQMAMERMNYVHFAFMGRSDIDLKELLKINGVDESCQMILHDARPDHHATSTETRMMLSTARAMYHINLYMHPQAIMIDSTHDEEHYFLRGLRDQMRGIKSALIELPERPGTRLAWLTKLDSASLAAWDKVHIDILIHAPPHGEANLGRLLNSLSRVDTGAMSVPHVTIELPHKIEPSVEKLVSRFKWPPAQGLVTNQPDMLSLRHRIPRPRLSEEESSVRFLESFWPKNALYSHVLVLSPHMELSPQFLHYVKYSLLYYRFSNAAIIQNWDTKLMGLGFSAPTHILDNSKPLAPTQEAELGGTSFLWQSPNSDAMLIPGDKWIELHSYVSQLLDRQHSSTATPAILAHKEVSKKYPAWLEFLLQLSRLRSYYTAYPSQETASVIAGMHNDIPDVPEEYEDDEDARKDAEGDGIRDEATRRYDAEWQVDILKTLPQDGALPFLTRLPVFSWDGQETDEDTMDTNAVQFSAQFRREVGQCKDSEVSRPPERLARDLFCETTREEA